VIGVDVVGDSADRLTNSKCPACDLASSAKRPTSKRTLDDDINYDLLR